MASLKNGNDVKLLSKNNSLSRLSSSVGATQPKAGKKASNGKDVNGDNIRANMFKYAVLNGNNQHLVQRVMKTRSQYWVDMTHLYVKQPNSSLQNGETKSKTPTQSGPKKFLAGNIMAPQNLVRPVSPLQVNFKWSPCSIKSDFTRLSSMHQAQ